MSRATHGNNVDTAAASRYAKAMESTSPQAIALDFFHRGFSCAQSVLAPFAEQLGMDTAQALRLASGFGAGLGRMRGTCGALSSLCMIAGHCQGNTVGSVQAKEHIYSLVRSLAHDFQTEFGSISCRELLHLDENQPESAKPSERTATYYAERPCERCVTFCAQRAHELLRQHANATA